MVIALYLLTHKSDFKRRQHIMTQLEKLLQNTAAVAKTMWYIRRKGVAEIFHSASQNCSCRAWHKFKLFRVPQVCTPPRCKALLTKQSACVLLLLCLLQNKSYVILSCKHFQLFTTSFHCTKHFFGGDLHVWTWTSHSLYGIFPPAM